MVENLGGLIDPLVHDRREATKELWKCLNIKDFMLRQKSRNLWLEEGDKNSRFFHNAIKDRQRRNAISKLEGKDGIVLTEEDVVLMERSFTEEEVKEAVWSCDGNKSPGPDGFSLEFFKVCWNVIKDDVLLFVRDFHEKDILSKYCSSSFITLIPKVSNPQSLSDYRPICLVGSLYKILAKMMATRLRRLIRKLVLRNQTTFILGRYILDGVLVVNEALDLAKRRKRGCVVLKVDFEKAYDRVSWNFVRYVLRKMGFGDRWMRWMEGSIFTNSVNVGDCYMEAASSFLSCKVGHLPFKFLGVRVGGDPRKFSLWKDLLKMLKYSKMVLDEIRSLQSKFLWNGSDLKKSINWVSWDTVCKTREEGCLGVKNFEIMNVALIRKWKWRMLVEKEAVWRDILEARYGNLMLKVLVGDNSVVEKKDSIWWRDIITSDNYENLNNNHFAGDIDCSVGNGAEIPLRYACWLGPQMLMEAFVELFGYAENHLAAVSSAGSVCDGKWMWSVDHLVTDCCADSVIQQQLTLLADLSSLMQQLEVRDSGDDGFVWNLCAE
ncbi:uncharacterized protein LOC131628373 [Vicia villosa]|uniref:uncharacterized protein LOC131628373 n=1 Tax=Vicia villosa TaxID=3911 RepID=UPI00273BEBE4|nr:uncharacterized protein LOC131628373 [Vicia villosa]